MKILIDGRMYGAQRTGGIGRYIAELITHLQPQTGADEFVVLTMPGVRLPQHQQWQQVTVPWRWYSLGEQLWLPRVMAQQQPDIVHFPHFTVPLYCPVPFVVTIHDLLLQRYPARKGHWHEWLTYPLRQVAYQAVLRRAVTGAERIIVPSGFTEQELVEFFPLAAGKTQVIPEAPAKLGQDTPDSQLEIGYNRDRPFILTVTNHYPHKNIETLLAAWRILQPQWSGELVIVGLANDYAEQLPDLPPAVRVLTNVSDAALQQLYAAAEACVFPSRYEGFGLPPLEAMQAGTPVVVSDRPVFHEVCGPAALYADPDSPQQFADAVRRILTNSSVTQQLQQLGTAQAAQFDWQQTAAAHHALYHASFHQTKKID